MSKLNRLKMNNILVIFKVYDDRRTDVVNQDDVGSWLGCLYLNVSHRNLYILPIDSCYQSDDSTFFNMCKS